MKKTIYMLAIVMMAASVSQAALMPWFDSFEDGTAALQSNWDASWNWSNWSVTEAWGGNDPDGVNALLYAGTGSYMERSIGDASSAFEVEFQVRVASTRSGGDTDIFSIEDSNGKDLAAVRIKNLDAANAQVELYNTAGSTAFRSFAKGDDYFKVKLAIDPAGTVDWYFNDTLVESGLALRESGVGNATLLELKHYGGGSFRSNIDAVTVAIPEPATLSLVAAFSGAMLFIRRKFMV